GMTSPVMPRPAPAATDTGLVTIGYVLQSFVDGEGADYNEIFRTAREPENWTATVTRSQAEKLLAAERAAQQRLLDIIEEANDDKEALEAKLAAAQKALEFYANRENWKNGRFEQAEGGTVLR